MAFSLPIDFDVCSVYSDSMTKKELIRDLTELKNSKDTESAHIDADELLVEFINDPEIKAAYDAIRKWYA